MPLPKRPVQHVVADRAVACVKVAVPAEWIVREQTGDYGIDLEVELASATATGRSFKAQVKGHEHLTWRQDDKRLESIRASTLTYWRQLAVPVIVFSVDTTTGDVHWGSVAVDVAAADVVPVSRSNRLPESANKLALHVLSWRDARSHRSALDAIPLLAERFKAELQQTGYDAHLALESHELHSLHELYEGVLRLREAVSLGSDLIPWQIWLARSRLVFGDAEAFCWGVHDEMMIYVNPLYEEAHARAKLLVEAEELTPENAELRAYFTDYRVRARFRSPLDELDDEFWIAFERVLDGCGALKFTKKR